MIQIKKGDILNIRELDVNDKKKTDIYTYIVVDIPQNRRFIVCNKLIDDKEVPGSRTTFTALELRKGLVWGGTKVEKKEECKKTEAEIPILEELKEYTYDELIDYCKRNKVKHYRKKNKKELLELIEKDIESR